MFQFDLILYIGNGKDVASVDDAGVFSSSVLDLPVEHKITALISLGDDLLTLSNPGDYINDSAIFRWNSYSDSFSVKDSVKETDVYAFLDADNYIYVVAKSGKIYLYTGTQLELFSEIREPVATTGHQLTTNFQGKPLIANGGRIFSLYRSNRNLPHALSGNYTCSAGVDATIESIVANGSQLLVSWTNGADAGVDELGENFANARVITPRFKKASRIAVHYDDLQGADIGIYSRLDGQTTWTSHEVWNDSEDSRAVVTRDSMIIKSGGQVLVTITPDVSNITDSPVIDSISIE
jgi:hypothetical protein